MERKEESVNTMKRLILSLLLVVCVYFAFNPEDSRSALGQFTSIQRRTNGDVYQLTAGSNVVLTPGSGKGNVKIDANDTLGNATNYVTLSGSTQTKTGGLNIGGSIGLGNVSPTSLIDINNGSITVRGTGSGLSIGGNNGAYQNIRPRLWF